MRTMILLLLGLLASLPAQAVDLDQTLGRTQLEVRSAPYAPPHGASSQAMQLRERLERLGYTRVETVPEAPGTWQQDGATWRIWRRAHRYAGRSVPDALLILRFDRGDLVEVADGDGRGITGRQGAWLEPEVLATSWTGDQAPALDVHLQDLPEAAWRPLLALEDHRFFEHGGVSGRALARAALANLKAGGVSEGGSTLTQQLIKNRDLTPRRGLDRKASEAVRALALEATATKEQILEAYLNTVYYGHVDGVGVVGIDRAARTWFGKPATRLTLSEGALLAAMVQAPNALNPQKHPQRARARRDHALDRMLELGWADADLVARAKAQPLGLDVHPPPRQATRHVLSRTRGVVERDASHRLDKGLGFEIDTTLDPWLQARAVDHTASWLDDLRRRYPKLRGAPLHAAVVVMQADTGDVLAYVGGDPGASGDAFDRASVARRQPGSTLKPLVLLEALDDCGDRPPVRLTTLIDDGPLDLDGWTPENHDRKDHGQPNAATSLVRSYNRPFVRLTEYCGRAAVASRLERAGLSVPDPIPAAMPLGVVEVSPVELLQAHSAFANGGLAATPRLVQRVGRANGTRTGGEARDHRRVAPPGPTWLTTHTLQAAVSDGSGQAARLQGRRVAGKTGTTSDSRDAWFVGHVDGLVAVVWVGLDEGRLGLGGGTAAAPLWQRVMGDAVSDRPARETPPPDTVVACRVDRRSGLAPGVFGAKATPLDTWCLRRARPGRDQPWRKESPDLVR